MRFLTVLTGLLWVCVCGCATTRQARRVETSGFLKDYSMLEEGKSGEALLVYRNPEADVSAYDKVQLEPVSIWRPADSDLGEIPEEELEQLAQHLHDAIVSKLEEDYEIVGASGPGVMRVRVAITEAAKSWIVLERISAIVPQLRLVSSLKRLATGTHSFVGKAGIEGEIIDSESGERLFAAVDRRAGANTIRGSWSSWSDVNDAFDFWAERLRDRLREERKRGEAVEDS